MRRCGYEKNCCFVTLILTVLVGSVYSQEKTAPSAPAEPKPAVAKEPPPQISDEPQTIDPVQFLPLKLVAPVTFDFTDKSLNEIIQWIEREQKIPVLVNDRALNESGVALGEPVTDHLKNEPLYLMLNRLRAIGLSWYLEDETLHLVTLEEANERLITESYVVSDLLDSGFAQDDLMDMLVRIEGWADTGGEGPPAPEMLGDVLIVRTTSSRQLRLAALLAALRKHGRQTFVADPPQHIALRQKLDQNVTVKFEGTPLTSVVQELAKQTGADIRLDTRSLRENKVREREPITVTLADRKLSTLLDLLLAKHQLTWMLQDGVMWITTIEQANEQQKIAAYDVRDLCRNSEEASALETAIHSQTSGPWSDTGAEGGNLVFPRPGTMVVLNTERVHCEVFSLLAMYRKALVASKPRKRGEDPQEVLTRYYRVEERMAEDLRMLLPELVQPQTWQMEQQPKGAGTIRKVMSGIDVVGSGIDSKNIKRVSADDAAKPVTAIVPKSVLIIRQTRSAHKEIAEIIDRIEDGDPRLVPGGAQGMGGGGGFGGGYFQVPAKKK